MTSLALLGGEVPWWQTVLALLALAAMAGAVIVFSAALIYAASGGAEDREQKRAERDAIMRRIERNTR